MREYLVEHKYCFSIKLIRGNDLYDAMRKAGLDSTVWTAIE